MQKVVWITQMFAEPLNRCFQRGSYALDKNFLIFFNLKTHFKGPKIFRLKLKTYNRLIYRQTKIEEDRQVSSFSLFRLRAQINVEQTVDYFDRLEQESIENILLPQHP